MKINVLALAAVMPLMGLNACNTLKKLIVHEEHTSPASTTLPDIYTLKGQTWADYCLIAPVRAIDSQVIVKVLRPGESTWHTCNAYEVRIDTNGTGGGGVSFKHIAYPSYSPDGTLIGLELTPYPVAPNGTKYEITSSLLVTKHDLY